MNNITFSELIRKEAGISRAKLSCDYNIPIRTLEEWDAGRRQPSDWVIDMLARVVFEDFWGITAPVYEIWKISKKKEEPELTTASYTKAITTARNLQAEADDNDKKIKYEIRCYYTGGQAYVLDY